MHLRDKDELKVMSDECHNSSIDYTSTHLISKGFSKSFLETPIIKYFIVSFLIMFSFGMVLAQDGISPELQEQLNQIEAETSAIRELDRLDSTELNFPTKAELEIYLRQEFDENFSMEEFADDLWFYVALDLLEPDFDLEAILFDFLLSQVAGFYDPELQSMNVILLSGETPDESIPIMEDLIYAHEYVHALQDQHFDLESLLEIIEEADNADYQLAIQSLVEGDASQVMTEYMMVLAEGDPIGFAQSVLSSGIDAGSLTIPDSVPQILSDELMFPYLNGQFFILDIVNERGWDVVNSAFTSNLPQSTEQIYHPEKYLAGDMPIEVTMPDMNDILGDNWRLVEDTPVGEFYLRQHLRTQISRRIAGDMATGWGGDRINVWVDETAGDMVWVLHQIWDTPTDATEFATGYAEFLGTRFDSLSTDDICWSGDTEAICVTQIDEDETRISFAMHTDLAMDLLMAGR